MSSSNKKDVAPNKQGLTTRDLEILGKVWGAMKTQPEIDYEKLAEACGMTNPRSASNAWSAIKKKLFADAPASAAGPTDSPASKKRKGRAAAISQDEVGDDNTKDDGSDEAPKTPAKKRVRAKPKPKTPATVKSENNDEETKKPVKAVKAKKEPKSEPVSEDDGSEGVDGADVESPDQLEEGVI